MSVIKTNTIKRIIAVIVGNISFWGLWYIGNLADKEAGYTLDGNVKFTPMIIAASMALMASTIYLTKENK